MKVVFGIAAYDGTITVPCAVSLDVTRRILQESKIESDILFMAGSCYVSAARNHIVAEFLKGDGTDLFFIDADVSWTADSVLKILKRPEYVVGGIYPMKTKEENYPVIVKTEDGIPIGRDGLIEATGLPAGFLKINRLVFEKMYEAYPYLKYFEDGKEIYDLFGCTIMFGRWWGDDLAFCKRWELIGGTMWVEPDLTLSHTGRKTWTGNYHEFLLKQPKEMD